MIHLAILLIILGCISALSLTDGSNVTECYRINAERHCFYTNGSMLSWNDAKEFCSGRNSTLPIITNKNTDDVFQRFLDLVSDTESPTVWLDAHAHNVSRHGRWHWISGKPSGFQSSSFSNRAENNTHWCSSIGNNSLQVTILTSNEWTKKHHYICQYRHDGESGLTSSSNASCIPRWIVYQNTYYIGHSKEYKNLRSPRECLDKCADDERCLNVVWDRFSGVCYRYYEDSKRSYDANADWFEIVRECFKTSGRRCHDAFQVNSTCYRVHKNERVNWFTAANRCQSNNGSLAVFDDNVRQYFPSSVMVEQAWIGLVKSWWIWPSMGNADVLYNKFNVNSSRPPVNPPRHPNLNYNCVVDTSRQWTVAECHQQHIALCQSVNTLPVPAETTMTTTVTTTETTVFASESTSQSGPAAETGLSLVIIIIIIAVMVVFLLITGLVICCCIRLYTRKSQWKRLSFINSIKGKNSPDEVEEPKQSDYEMHTAIPRHFHEDNVSIYDEIDERPAPPSRPFQPGDMSNPQHLPHDPTDQTYIMVLPDEDHTKPTEDAQPNISPVKDESQTLEHHYDNNRQPEPTNTATELAQQPDDDDLKPAGDAQSNISPVTDESQTLEHHYDNKQQQEPTDTATEPAQQPDDGEDVVDVKTGMAHRPSVADLFSCDDETFV